MTELAGSSGLRELSDRLQGMLDGIAYVARHRLSVEAVPGDGSQVRVRMPASPDNRNIAGSLHASALFCVAETAAGVAAWCIEADPATMVYVRSVKVEYPARATGDVTAEAAVVSLTGNDAEVIVSVSDSDGRVVLDAVFSYALRRTDGPNVRG